MEHQLWKAIVALAEDLDKTPLLARHNFPDWFIVAVYYWAVIHDRPTSWACQRRHWPIHLRRRPLPSPSTMSRRLRHPTVSALLKAIVRRVAMPDERGPFWMIDGKPLPVGGASGDTQAKAGRGAGGLARGYKLHAILNPQGKFAAWRIAPMNVDERTVAAELLQEAGIQGYLVADANYDSNPLHAVCDALADLHLVTPRRRGKTASGTGHRRQTQGRTRLLERLDHPTEFAADLLDVRDAIERHFGNLTNWGGGLGPLPAWVRTLPRVERWVEAKLAVNALKRHCKISTCDD
jgi:hypothetical protein